MFYTRLLFCHSNTRPGTGTCNALGCARKRCLSRARIGVQDLGDLYRFTPQRCGGTAASVLLRTRGGWARYRVLVAAWAELLAPNLCGSVLPSAAAPARSHAQHRRPVVVAAGSSSRCAVGGGEGGKAAARARGARAALPAAPGLRPPLCFCAGAFRLQCGARNHVLRVAAAPRHQPALPHQPGCAALRSFAVTR